MRKSPVIARIWGVPLRVHWSFSLLLLLVVVDYASGPVSKLLMTVAWFVAIFASVVVHELSHCVVARRRGFEVKEILLLPIGGVSEIPRIRRGSPDEFVVSLAGPLASLCLAALLAVVTTVIGERIWPPTMMAGPFLVRMMWANLVLGGFNLLPVLPLDGGHVLRAELARRRPESIATRIAARAGTVVGSGMVVVGLFWNLWITLVGMFIIVGGGAERQVSLVREMIGERTVRDVMIPCGSLLEASLTVGETSESLRARPDQSTPVVDHGHYLGMLSAADIEGATADQKLARLADKAAPLLRPDDDLYPDAIGAFQESNRHQLAVGEGGAIVGLLYDADVKSLLRRAEQVNRRNS
jgi:Zn-dependent protease